MPAVPPPPAPFLTHSYSTSHFLPLRSLSLSPAGGGGSGGYRIDYVSTACRAATG